MFALSSPLHVEGHITFRPKCDIAVKVSPVFGPRICVSPLFPVRISNVTSKSVSNLTQCRSETKAKTMEVDSAARAVASKVRLAVKHT